MIDYARILKTPRLCAYCEHELVSDGAGYWECKNCFRLQIFDVGIAKLTPEEIVKLNAMANENEKHREPNKDYKPSVSGISTSSE